MRATYWLTTLLIIIGMGLPCWSAPMPVWTELKANLNRLRDQGQAQHRVSDYKLPRSSVDDGTLRSTGDNPVPTWFEVARLRVGPPTIEELLATNERHWNDVLSGRDPYRPDRPPRDPKLDVKAVKLPAVRINDARAGGSGHATVDFDFHAGQEELIRKLRGLLRAEARLRGADERHWSALFNTQLVREIRLEAQRPKGERDPFVSLVRRALQHIYAQELHKFPFSEDYPYSSTGSTSERRPSGLVPPPPSPLETPPSSPQGSRSPSGRGGVKKFVLNALAKVKNSVPDLSFAEVSTVTSRF